MSTNGIVMSSFCICCSYSMPLSLNANKTIAINNGKMEHIRKKIGFCFLNKISICKLIFFVRECVCSLAVRLSILCIWCVVWSGWLHFSWWLACCLFVCVEELVVCAGAMSVISRQINHMQIRLASTQNDNIFSSFFSCSVELSWVRSYYVRCIHIFV